MNVSKTQLKRSFSKGFTLVELLVVIAIIGVLLTVAGNGIKSMNGGKGTSTGLATVSALVEEARSTAESRGESVYLLVNNEYVPPGDTQNPGASDHFLRQFFLGVNRDNDNPSAGIKVISKGTLLPTDTYFNKELSEGGGARFRQDARVALPSANPSGNSDCIVFEFNSKGVLVSPNAEGDNHARIILSGGAMARNPDGAVLNMTGGAANDHEGLVIWKSGRTTLLRNPRQIVGDSPPRRFTFN